MDLLVNDPPIPAFLPLAVGVHVAVGQKVHDLDKLASILQMSDVNSLSVIHMEVPCCTGLVRIAQAAIEASGKSIPLHDVAVSTKGEVLNET